MTKLSQDNIPRFIYKSILYGILLVVIGGLGCSKPPQVIPPKPVITLPQKPEQKPELTHFQRWQSLIKEKRYLSTLEKLVSVNTFFNEFDFAEDQYLWGREDYWATLFETLTRTRGDCEDFTIAKYFTLRYLNVPAENLRITYVVSLNTSKRHMVLTCRINPGQEPVVLDTLNNHLLPVSRRADLIPVYSFNSHGYWLSEQKKGWQGNRLGSASQLSMWRNLLERTARNRKKLFDS